MTHHVALAALAVGGLAVSLGSGCGRPGDELADVIVASADISSYDEVEIAALGGAVFGSGVLSFTDSNGGAHSVDVGIGGPVFGMVFDFHVLEEDQFWEGSGGASMGIPEGGVPVPDLFEMYSGTGASASMALGGGVHDLENEPGVTLEAGGIWAGVGMMVAFEWFSITPEGELQ